MYRALAQPYSAVEFLRLLKRRWLGPTQHPMVELGELPRQQTLALGGDVHTRLGFVGDILSLGGKRLSTGPRIRAYLADCDALVGNFESTITREPGPLKAPRHQPQILEALAELFPPERTFLGQANNHAGDFGPEIWGDTMARAEAAGFQVFGSRRRPYIDLPGDVRVVAATQWSNRPCDYVAWLADAEAQACDNRFNILYVHWGYELELSPRAEIVALGDRLLTRFDAIIGHHSHTPQPAVFRETAPGAAEPRLVAYGLGDFCAGGNKAYMWYGKALKLGMGGGAGGRPGLGSVDWEYTLCRPTGRDRCETECADALPECRSLRPEQWRITLRKLGLMPWPSYD